MMTFTSASAQVRSPAIVPSASSEDLSLSRLKHRAAHGLVLLALRYGLVIVFNLAGTIVLSRLLGPTLWGVLAIAQVVALSAQEVLGRGFAAYLIKKDAPPTSSDIGNVFALQHLLGLIFLLAALGGSQPLARWYGHPELTALLPAAGVAAYACAWRSVPVALLERRLAYFKVAAIEVLESATFVAVAVLLVWTGHAIAGLTLAILLRGLLPTVLAYCLQPVRPKWFFHCDTLVAVDFGLAVTASSIVNIAMLSIPALFLGRHEGMAAIGVAQMAFSLYANLLFVTAAVMRLGLSTYSRLSMYTDELHRSVNQHLEILSVVLVPAIAIFSGLSPLWVPWMFGTHWQLLPGLLLALAPGYFFASVFWGVLNPALLVSGKHRQVLLWLVGFTALYALLAYALTPRWGALGVAIAFSVIEIGLHPLLFVMYSRLHGRLPYQKVFLEMAVGAASMILLWELVQRDHTAAFFLLGIYLLFWYVRNAGFMRMLRPLASSLAGSYWPPKRALSRI